MTSRVLPTTRHIKELIKHAEEHLSHGSNSDFKFSLIHADNSIEIMLKEHLRYDKEKSWGEVDKKGFYQLLNDCEEVNLIKDSKEYFLAYHDMRNSVYHIGTLVPIKDDVEGALGLAKTLFNELHPDQQFEEAKIEVPSQQSVNNMMQFMGTPNHLRGISLVSVFSKYLKNNGYSVTLEYIVAGRIRADIVAEKNNLLIVCELKSIAIPIGTSALHQLKAMYTHLVELNPSKQVEGWLITDGTFTEQVKIRSKDYNIKLIDGKELEKILGKDYRKVTEGPLYDFKKIQAYLFFPPNTPQKNKNLEYHGNNYRLRLIVNYKTNPPKAYYLTPYSIGWNFLRNNSQFWISETTSWDQESNDFTLYWCKDKKFKLKPRFAELEDLLEEDIIQ